MKAIFFDTGPIISLTTNNLLWILAPLKKRFGGKFYITPAVKYELVSKPLHIKRFEFEALQVMKLLREGVLECYEHESIKNSAENLLSIANACFMIRGHPLRAVHYAEMEILASALHSNADCLVIDERTTRYFIESPEKMKYRFEKKLHSKISEDKGTLKSFAAEVKGLKTLRSVELVTMAFELGMMDEYLPEFPNARETLLDSLLWGLKLNGCAITKDDIEEIKRIAIKN